MAASMWDTKHEHQMKESNSMHENQKQEMKLLAAARAAIGEGRGHANELPDPERDRRVEIYARQVEQFGRITEWLTASTVRKAYMSRRSRFANGDALGRRRVG